MTGYRDLELAHRAEIETFLAADPPQISELTFTNLFIWRGLYRPVWRAEADCLAGILQPEGGSPRGLPPVGPGDKAAALAAAVRDMSAMGADPLIARADADLIDNWVDRDLYEVAEDRDNSDYVYLTEDLKNLSGRRFHKKKNHVNKFYKSFNFEYRPLDGPTIGLALELQEEWCGMRACAADESLNAEDMAVHQALSHAGELDWSGGAILINGRVEAFSIGEELNPETTVCHVEKANPDVPGLYAAINHQCCLNAWPERTYINREQDLGSQGLRRAKESYHPLHLVDKFTIRPKP